MKNVHRKLNMYFFGEAAASPADQVVYYGAFLAGVSLLGVIAMM